MMKGNVIACHYNYDEVCAGQSMVVKETVVVREGTVKERTKRWKGIDGKEEGGKG